jgi:hypothetical protein
MFSLHHLTVHVSVVMFNYSKIGSTLVSMVKLFTIFTMVKQWVQQWIPLLHKCVFNCHMRMERYRGNESKIFMLPS